MFAKTAVVAVASLALVEQALALNAHRHLHLQKKDIIYVATETALVTEWVTVTVYDGEDLSTAQADSPGVKYSKSRPTENYAPIEAEESSSSTSSTTSSTTTKSSSTSVVVVVTPPPAPTTTLVTKVAPPPAEESPAEDSPIVAAAPTREPAKVTLEVAPAAPETTVAPAPAAESPVEDAAPAPTPTPAKTPTSSGGAGLGSKRGLAYNEASLLGNFADSGKCKWAYNWDSRDNGISGGFNYVPMLWGPIDVHTSRWQKNADDMLAKGSTHLLSFNECDNPGQCNLDAGSAAAAHIKYMNPYASKAKIGSPAITNSNIAGQGLDWLQAFMDSCGDNCAIDFCVTHWYSPVEAVDTLFSHLKRVHEICKGKPVWLTEFAPFGSDAQITSFVKDVLPQLDGLDYVDAYSYFMVNQGSLLSGSGLSSYGQAYATV